jgi:hypothetical protein
VPSLNPLYTEADLTMDPALVGTWVDKESGETWTFSNSEKVKYTLLHVDTEGLKNQYDARLVKIEDKLFLDIIPAKSGFTQNDPFKDRFIATHTFVRVSSNGSTVQISYMEPSWLKDHLAENPSAIKHEKIGGEIVLTSSPKETQKFLIAHLNTPGAFSQPAEFVLKRGAR